MCPDVTVCAEGPSVRGAGTCGEQMGSSLPCGAHKQAENTDRDKPMDVCFVYLFIAIDRGETEVYRGRRRSFPHFAGEEAGSQERLVTRLNDTDSKWQGRMQTSQPIPSLCTHPIVHAGGASVSELLFPGKCSGGLPRGSRGRSHAKSGQKSVGTLACRPQKAQLSDGEEKGLESQPQELNRQAANVRAWRGGVGTS